jgi:hypothetical protein
LLEGDEAEYSTVERWMLSEGEICWGSNALRLEGSREVVSVRQYHGMLVAMTRRRGVGQGKRCRSRDEPVPPDRGLRESTCKQQSGDGGTWLGAGFQIVEEKSYWADVFGKQHSIARSGCGRPCSCEARSLPGTQGSDGDGCNVQCLLGL